MTLSAGFGGLPRHGCAAISDGGRLVAVCEQERVTRVRGAACNPSGLPDEALDTLLERLGRSRQDVGRYTLAGSRLECGTNGQFERLDDHFAHACGSYLTSPFSSAAIVVCDHDAPKVSVWEGSGANVAAVEWPWSGPGFADVYSMLATVFGRPSEAGEQRFEALARLRPDHRDAGIGALLGGDATSLDVSATLAGAVEQRLASEPSAASGAALAAALQTRLGELFVAFLADVRRRTACDRLCLAGSFFYHSSMNTVAKRAGLFADVFVPVDPGSGALAVGAALHTTGSASCLASPFLGPAYSAVETKAVLDNCKLQYGWESEDGAIGAAVEALQQGLLVGWFDGAMEWGRRALGARSILANPFSPYVLENLNRFLKQREPWRGYALSGLERGVDAHFDGPATAPFMECDYRPRDPERFHRILPTPEAAVRVQTVGEGASPRFRRLLEAFEAASGLPFVVNTSFNGFHEPIVCSPRDAVRVFYGSGIDVLVLDQYVLRK